METLELLSAIPGFIEVGYFFVKKNSYKEGMRPFNGTVLTMIPKESILCSGTLPMEILLQ